MPIRPGARGLIEKRSKTKSRARVASSLKDLGSTLLALGERKRQIEMEEEKMRREREMLDLRIAEEERLKVAQDMARGTEERLKMKAAMDLILDREKFEETKAENIREQKRFEGREGRLTDKAALSAAAAKSKDAAPERIAKRYREEVLGSFEDSLGKSIFNQIIRETPGDPGQQGYSKALREKASEYLLGTVDEELSEKAGRIMRKPGILDDFPGTDKMALFEESLQWMVKNASNLGWLIPKNIGAEITGFAMPLVPPFRENPLEPAHSLPVSPRAAGLVPPPGSSSSEEDFDKALFGQ